jgi:hypothetical protein
MELTVRKHTENLQKRIEQLNVAAMSGHKTQTERNDIESEIRVATLALNHFRAALEAEEHLFTDGTLLEKSYHLRP